MKTPRQSGKYAAATPDSGPGRAPAPTSLSHSTPDSAHTLAPEQALCLVVDDNAFARATLRDLLEDLGYTVMEAEDGGSALSCCGKIRPDLIFLDLGLPDMDGDAVLERLLITQPDAVVIVVSGSESLAAPISAFKKGALDYIPKNTLSADSLQRAIRHSTERSALHKELLAIEERHRKLIENLPLVICTLNEELEMTFVSQASTLLLGVAPETIEADPAWFMNGIHPDDCPAVREILTAAFAAEEPEPVECEFRFLANEESPFFLQLRASVSSWISVRNGQPVRQMEGALLDLSERVFLERVRVQREKLNTLAALVDEIAHEFRNPIFALASFARTLQRKYPDACEADMLLEEARRLETLINRVQEYLTPVEVVWQPCSLGDVLRLAASMMRPLLALRNIELKLDIEDTPEIESNEDMLTQIVAGMFSLAEQQARAGSVVYAHCKNLVKGLLLNVSIETPESAPGGVYGPKHSQNHDPGMGTLPDMVLDAEVPFSPFTDGGKPQPMVLGYKMARALGCLLSLRHEQGRLIATLLIPLAGKDQQIEAAEEEARQAAGQATRQAGERRSGQHQPGQRQPGQRQPGEHPWESEAFLTDMLLSGKKKKSG